MLATPILTEADYAQAVARLDELFSSRPGDPDWSERGALVDAIEAYDEAGGPLAPPSPIEAIRFRMRQGGLLQKDLVPYLGSPSRVSEVLSGKRQLTVRMIRALHTGLSIPLPSLLGISRKSAGESHAEVDWRLPVSLITGIVTRAVELGLSEEQLVTRMLGTELAVSRGATVFEPVATNLTAVALADEHASGLSVHSTRQVA